MGLFDWILGVQRYPKSLPDRVWMSSADMQRHFPAALQPVAGKNALTLVAAHFQKTLDELREMLGK